MNLKKCPVDMFLFLYGSSAIVENLSLSVADQYRTIAVM